MFPQRNQKRVPAMKRVGRTLFICGETGVKSVDLVPVKDHIHRLIHKYEGEQPETLLGKILKQPEEALRLRGSRRVNLLILMAVKEGPKLSNLLSGLFTDIINGTQYANIKVGKKQRRLLKLFAQEKRSLRRLLKRSPRVFLEFMNAFNLDGRKLPAVVQALRDWQDYKDGLRDARSIEMKIHCEFCTENVNKPVIFSEEYEAMIDNARRNKTTKFLMNESNFYPENLLYNELLTSRIGAGFFDKSVLERTFYTANEKLVKNFVKRRLNLK